MADYFYEALDKGGKQVRGIIAAGGEEVIVERLRGMGFYPLKVVLHHKSAVQADILALPGLRLIFHRVKTRHITTFTRQLATLMDAGLPIVRSLLILQRQVESVILKEKIGAIARDIESGSSLSAALAKHPRVFDTLYVNMVRAGEIGGVLEAVLNKISDYLEKRQALISKVRSAMMYPAVVGVVAALIVTFILVKILPKFQDIFAQFGKQLPIPTQVLVAASNLIMHEAWKIGLAAALIWFLYTRLNRTREGKYVFDRMKLKLPIFGTLFRKVAIQRFCGTLATLIQSGVPILQALDIVRDTSGNEVFARAADRIYNSVKDGESINEPMEACGVFPPLVVNMVAVGEESGAIDQLLIKVSEAYERDVSDTVNALTSILEPLLIVSLGGIIGMVVVALYLPLFKLWTVVIM